MPSRCSTRGRIRRRACALGCVITLTRSEFSLPFCAQDLSGVEQCSPLAVEMATFYQPYALSSHAMQDFECAVCLTRAKDAKINDALTRLKQMISMQMVAK